MGNDSGQTRPHGKPGGKGGDLLARALEVQSAAGSDTDGWLRLDPQTGRFAMRHIETRSLRNSLEQRGWIVGGTLARSREIGDRVVIRDLVITPEDDSTLGNGIDDAVLRSVSMKKLFAAIGRRLAEIDETTRDAYEALTGNSPYWEQPLPRATHRGSSAGRDRYLRALAVAYLELQGGDEGLYKALARRFADARGNPKPESTLKEDIRAAHRAGWLGAASHGRGQRSAGPRLLAERDTTEGEA